MKYKRSLAREYIHFTEAVLALRLCKKRVYKRTAEEALRLRGDYSRIIHTENILRAEEALRLRGDYSLNHKLST